MGRPEPRMVRRRLLKRDEVASPDFIGIAMTGRVCYADNMQSLAAAGIIRHPERLGCWRSAARGDGW